MTMFCSYVIFQEENAKKKVKEEHAKKEVKEEENDERLVIVIENAILLLA